MGYRSAAWVSCALLLAACSSAPLPAGAPASPGSSPASAPTSSQAAGVPDSAPAGLERFYGQSPEWSSCGDAECATLTVPVDYADPDGETIDIALLRVPARGDRLGSLVVNPGGPGGSGTEYAAASTGVVSERLLDHYDLVGFDPRGVGQSAPVECLSDADIDALLDSDGTPDDAADVTELVSLSDRFADACAAEEGEFLEHLSTSDAARDMDLIRSALGEDQLDYLGISYGTHLGATYAALFPDRVGRFVLDGPLPADLDAAEVTYEQARGFEDSLRRFAADCLRSGECPLGDPNAEPSEADIDAALQSLRDLLASLEASPLPGVDPSRPLTEGAATYAVLMSMYDPVRDWPELREALGAAIAGDGTVLQSMLNARMRRDETGAYRGNDIEAFFAVSCSDRAVSGGAEAAERLADDWASELPTVGAYLAWGNLPCEQWAGEVVPAPRAVAGVPPILVVATTHDPATPLPWGQVLADQLGTGVLLIRDGDGHTAYREGSTCIDDAIDGFLIDGVLPEPDTVCS